MAIFEYDALTSAGRLMKGTIEAGTDQEANELLKGMQLTVNSVEKAKAKRPKTAIGRNEFIPFNQLNSFYSKNRMEFFAHLMNKT